MSQGGWVYLVNDGGVGWRRSLANDGVGAPKEKGNEVNEVNEGRKRVKIRLISCGFLFFRFFLGWTGRTGDNNLLTSLVAPHPPPGLEDLFGYWRAWALGRNFRFLLGPEKGIQPGRSKRYVETSTPTAQTCVCVCSLAKCFGWSIHLIWFDAILFVWISSECFWDGEKKTLVGGTLVGPILYVRPPKR